MGHPGFEHVKVRLYTVQGMHKDTAALSMVAVLSVQSANIALKTSKDASFCLYLCS